MCNVRDCFAELPGSELGPDSFSCSIALTPTNTLQAAHAIVTNPQSNVSTIYGVTPPPGVQQFTPTLSTAPDGWELALNFTQTDFNQPRGVAIDGTGNVWVVNYVAGTVTKLDPNGAKLITSSGSGNLNNPTYAAIDTSGNAWITNLGSNTVTKLNSDGSFAINYSTTFNQPQALAIDASGNKWVTNSGFAGSGISFSVTKIDTGGTLTNYAPSGAAFSAPIGIAISSSTGNLWVTNTVSPGSISTMVSDGSSGSNFNPLGSSLKFPQDLKLDNSGNVWVANQNNSVLELNSAGSQLNNFTPSALNNPLSLVIDSALMSGLQTPTATAWWNSPPGRGSGNSLHPGGLQYALLHCARPLGERWGHKQFRLRCLQRVRDDRRGGSGGNSQSAVPDQRQQRVYAMIIRRRGAHT